VRKALEIGVWGPRLFYFFPNKKKAKLLGVKFWLLEHMIELNNFERDNGLPFTSIHLVGA